VETLPLDSSTHPAPEKLGDILTNAFRYWEPRRIPYNLVLVAVVAFFVVKIGPHLRGLLRWVDILPLFVLAVMANVCYSAAYVADIPVQYSSFRAAWQRWRWALWLIGTLFAAALAFYWMGDEVFPDVVNRN
jgi:hypothetical protein